MTRAWNRNTRSSTTNLTASFWVPAASFAVFARILLQSPEAFPVFFSRAAAVPGMPAVAGGAAEPGQQLVLSFLDLWLDKFDSIAASHHRKLASLALCVLLTLPLPEILQRFGLIAAHITSVWFEVRSALDFSRRHIVQFWISFQTVVLILFFKSGYDMCVPLVQRVCVIFLYILGHVPRCVCVSLHLGCFLVQTRRMSLFLKETSVAEWSWFCCDGSLGLLSVV